MSRWYARLLSVALVKPGGAPLNPPIDSQQFANGQISATRVTTRQKREQLLRFLSHFAFAVIMITRVVYEFHRQKTVEPTKKPLLERRFARGVFANFTEGFPKPLFLQEAQD